MTTKRNSLLSTEDFKTPLCCEPLALYVQYLAVKLHHEIGWNIDYGRERARDRQLMHFRSAYPLYGLIQAFNMQPHNL